MIFFCVFRFLFDSFFNLSKKKIPSYCVTFFSAANEHFSVFLLRSSSVCTDWYKFVKCPGLIEGTACHVLSHWSDRNKPRMLSECK